MTAGELPARLQHALAIALDDDAPRAARLRAVMTLERAPEVHRAEVARALVPALSHGPDIAGRVHLALLVLLPGLRLVRDDHGFVVVERGFGLDELHRLFAPGEDTPAFLQPPERPAPRAYRDPRAVREEELAALTKKKRSEHDAFVTRLSDLGLVPDDLDDDDDVHDGTGRHRRLVPLKGGTPWTSFSFVDDRDLYLDNGERVVALGCLRPGAWWSESTVGDHPGARRLRIGVAVDMAPAFTTRRERTFEVGHAGITLTAGHEELNVDVHGRGVVIWVDSAAEAGGEVVGVTLSWSAWRRAAPPRR